MATTESALEAGIGPDGLDGVEEAWRELVRLENVRPGLEEQPRMPLSPSDRAQRGYRTSASTESSGVFHSSSIAVNSCRIDSQMLRKT